MVALHISSLVDFTVWYMATCTYPVKNVNSPWVHCEFTDTSQNEDFVNSLWIHLEISLRHHGEFTVWIHRVASFWINWEFTVSSQQWIHIHITEWGHYEFTVSSRMARVKINEAVLWHSMTKTNVIVEGWFLFSYVGNIVLGRKTPTMCNILEFK